MNEDILKRVQANPKFAELVQKRSSLGWLLSIVMLAIYYGFILVLAFLAGHIGRIAVWRRHHSWHSGGYFHHSVGVCIDRHLCSQSQHRV